MLLEDGEPLFSRRGGSEVEARFAAESCRQDLLRTHHANPTKHSKALAAGVNQRCQCELGAPGPRPSPGPELTMTSFTAEKRS
jgi:hypothetical protein